MEARCSSEMSVDFNRLNGGHVPITIAVITANRRHPIIPPAFDVILEKEVQ
jgi:hypothetical protein